MKRTAILTALLSTGCVTMQEPAVRGLPPDDPGASLSAVWVGHATVLLRLGEQRVITDPNLSDTLVVLPRLVRASLRPEDVPSLDAVLISHMHFDHFDRWTLDRLPHSTPVLYPHGGEAYATNLAEPRQAMDRWQSTRIGDLEITAVPVAHRGGRYGFDGWWNHAFTGYVIEGGGRTVFFAGDTGYDAEKFKAIGARFPNIDLALIPIAPYLGRSGNPVHANPAEALRIFHDVGAREMIPIHFDTYPNSMLQPNKRDPAREELVRLCALEGLDDRVHILQAGERWAQK